KGYQTSISVSINITTVPQHYWVFVPAPQFLAPTLKTVVFFGDRQPEVFKTTQPAGVVIVQNNVVVNNIIQVNFIQQQTKQQVTVAKVETTTDPNAAKSAPAAGANTITAFVEPVKPADKTVAPPKVEEKTAVQTPTKGQAPATGNATVNANPRCADAAFAKANPKTCASGNASANVSTGAATPNAGAATTTTGNAGANGNANGKTSVQGNVNAGNPRCADAAYA